MEALSIGGDNRRLPNPRKFFCIASRYDGYRTAIMKLNAPSRGIFLGRTTRSNVARLRHRSVSPGEANPAAPKLRIANSRPEAARKGEKVDVMRRRRCRTRRTSPVSQRSSPRETRGPGSIPQMGQPNATSQGALRQGCRQHLAVRGTLHFDPADGSRTEL
jgi:hypothetical protein